MGKRLNMYFRREDNQMAKEKRLTLLSHLGNASENDAEIPHAATTTIIKNNENQV
jgi:hypothetical protein